MVAHFNRTKIVATLGPASSEPAQIAALVQAGVDVFRVNMSHADEASARELIQRVRDCSEHVAVLVDTRGPELRTSDVAEPFQLEDGSSIAVRAGNELSTPEVIYIKHPDLPARLGLGSLVFVNDGLIQLEVTSTGSAEVTCHVRRGGLMTSRRGVNVPGVDVSPPELIEEDVIAIRMAADVQAEYLAASFVQTAADVDRIRRLLDECGGKTEIIAKVETRRAVDEAKALLRVSDGLMVARGDLGVEIPPEEVPLVQKRLVSLCNLHARPVIVATQMLESMVENPVATRAETSDVANAIIDGADAVMLSGETAKGRYPVDAVHTMRRISEFVERNADLFQQGIWQAPARSTGDFIAKAACRAAEDRQLDYIVALTTRGTTVRRISRNKPRATILATTPDPAVARRMSLLYGVVPVVMPNEEHQYGKSVHRALSVLVERGVLRPEHRVVVVFGVPFGGGKTNFLACDSVAALLKGTGEE